MSRGLAFSLAFAALAALTVACATTSEKDETSGAAPGTDTDADPGPPGTDDRKTPGASPDGGPPVPPPNPTKPGCAQTAYTEPLPTTTSLSGLVFTQASAEAYLLSALERRFPLGKHLVEGGIANPLGGQIDCVETFLPAQSRSSAANVLRRASTVVHECGHFFDLGESSGPTHALIVREDLRFECSQGDTTTRGGKTFARSLLRTDAYYGSRPACAGASGNDCDLYANIYLNGSPTDADFQSGDQGYNLLLEEASQYVNSLATALAFEDAYTGGASERDGILTFLWYVPRYLKLAREEHPAAYAHISGDPCWRQATLTVWDRGWFYLNATKSKSALGIDDAAIEALVLTPALTAEIDALRALECD